MVRATFEEKDEIAGEGVFGLDAFHLFVLTPRGARDVHAQCALEDELGEATAIEGVGSDSAGSVGIAELLSRNGEDLLAHVGYFRASRFGRSYVQSFGQFDRTLGHRLRIDLADPRVKANVGSGQAIGGGDRRSLAARRAGNRRGQQPHQGGSHDGGEGSHRGRQPLLPASAQGSTHGRSAVGERRHKRGR